MPKVSVIVPTYNEADNIQPLLRGIVHALDGRDFEVIIVDDNSPDGTARNVETFAQEEKRVQLIRRPGKMGLGSAVMEGFAQSRGDYIVMMDADLSHRPEDLEKLVQAASEGQIVIGSRYISGGQICGWSPFRHLSSRVAIWIARLLLGLKARDLTSGFALYQRQVIQDIAPRLNPQGFKLLLEVLAKTRGVAVVEVPIVFNERIRGRSKFGVGEVIRFLRLCLRLRKESNPTKANKGS